MPLTINNRRRHRKDLGSMVLGMGMGRSMVLEDMLAYSMVLGSMALGMGCSKDRDPSSNSLRERKL